MGLRCATAATVAALWLCTSHASAQLSDEDKRAAARGLASEGARAWRENQYAEARDLFKRAEDLVHAPPHLLYLARASEKLGKLVQAREYYLKVIREELPPNAPKAFVEAQQAAGAEVPSLEPRLAKLTIVVRGAAAKEADVTVDGAKIGKALVGVAFPADPGKHVLHASAPGWESDDVTIVLAEGGKETATVSLVHKVAIVSGAGPEDPASVLRRKRFRTAGWISLGVGVVGVGAGTFFMLQNRSKRDEGDALCGAVCPSARRSDIQSLDRDADDAATLSWVGYGVGAAGALASGVFLLLGASRSSTTAAQIAPYVGPGAAGLEGVF